MRRPTSTARTAHGHGANPGRRRGGSAGSGLPASTARGSRRSVIGALHISALLHSNVSSISIDGRIAAACSSIDCRFAAACASISIDGRIAAAACASASIDCRFAAACRIISSPVMMRPLVAPGRQDRQAPSIAHTGTVRKPGGIHVAGTTSSLSIILLLLWWRSWLTETPLAAGRIQSTTQTTAVNVRAYSGAHKARLTTRCMRVQSGTLFLHGALYRRNADAERHAPPSARTLQQLDGRRISAFPPSSDSTMPVLRAVRERTYPPRTREDARRLDLPI